MHVADVTEILAADCFNFAMVEMRKQVEGIDYVEVRRVDVPVV